MGWIVRRNQTGKYEAVYTIFGMPIGYGLIASGMCWPYLFEFDSLEDAKNALKEAKKRKPKAEWVWKE